MANGKEDGEYKTEEKVILHFEGILERMNPSALETFLTATSAGSVKHPIEVISHVREGTPYGIGMYALATCLYEEAQNAGQKSFSPRL